MALFGFDSSIIPDIDFCQKDASVIESEVISNHEKFFTTITRVAKTLGRADPVRLFLLTNVAQLVTQRSIVDSTGKQNLLKYSKGANLDNVGAKWGTRGKRLKATKAKTLLEFTLSNPITAEVVVQVGTIAQSNSGIRFLVTKEGIIKPGEISVRVEAEAEVAGSLANGLLPGQINTLVSWNQPFMVEVANLTTSSGGANTEEDDHLRARIWMAPESFPTTGPKEAYEYWAASANPDIIDVGVWSAPEVAGQVYVYPLMVDGTLPTPEICDQVLAVLNDEKIRPLTDQVFVQMPILSNFTPDVKYWIKTSDQQFSSNIQEKVDQAFKDYLLWQRSMIGRDINPSECDKKCVAAGAKRTDIPGSTTFLFVPVDEKSVATEVSPLLTYMGLEDE